MNEVNASEAIEIANALTVKNLLLVVFTVIIIILVVRAFRNKPSA